MQFPTHSSNVLAWAHTRPWFAELRVTPQDPVFHQEGDVGTHTDMVYAEVMKLQLPEEQKYILALTAVFHDIAKPQCTEIVDGRVSSPGHGRKGASRFVQETYKFLSPALRNTIYHLIRLHGKPVYALDTAQTLLPLWSQDVSVDLLLQFVACDMRGRICPDLQSLILTLDLLRQEAIDLNCLSTPYVFSNPEQKIQLNSGAQTSLAYVPFFKPEFKVYVMHGLPGSGKDFYIKKHLSTIPMVSFDALRLLADEGEIEHAHVISEAKEQCRKLLAAKTTFVFNATNLTRSLRLKWINLFYQYGAEIHGIYLEPAAARLFAQNSNRTHVVPETAIVNMFSILEYPQGGEYHSLEMHLA